MPTRSHSPAAPWVAGAVTIALLGGLVWLWATRTRPVISPDCQARAGNHRGTLYPDQAGNAALIAAIGARRELPARAGTIALATAMQESKLRNIDYGDRDSLGLFQQRPSQGWGTPAQIMDSHYATNAFYDRLVQVSGYQSMPVTDAAQRVQRSGFPQAYAAHESMARAFSAALYGQFPAALVCRLNPPLGLSRQSKADSGLIPRAQVVADTAARELGGPALARVSAGQLSGAVEDGLADAGEGLTDAGGGDGTWVGVSFPDTDDGQTEAWRLAHWAVASADRLAIVDVRTQGRRWDRAAHAHEWAEVPNTAPASAAVWIRVANPSGGG